MGLHLLPKISIITPSLNQGRFIEQCILSVMNQGYSDFEHIVIDGGSTDDTISILQKYPHVTWISEPDNGQSDALNKGLSIATGSLIGWLNSDDFYADNIFGEVAEYLRDYPIVIGQCELTDEKGVPKTRIVNKERSWFDLMKYWVPYSIPTQPSIFMTSEILEDVKRTDGLYFDPDLNYCMDYDLWLRISHLTPLSHRIEGTLAYYRMTESNKTSDSVEGMSYAEPEMSKVHRRYRDLPFDHAYRNSIILLSNNSEIISANLNKVSELDIQDCEIIIPIQNNDRALYQQIKNTTSLFNKNEIQNQKNRFVSIPLIQVNTGADLLNESVNKAAGEVVIFVDGSIPEKNNLLENSIKKFFQDSIGSIFQQNILATRKLALLEVDGFSDKHGKTNFDMFMGFVSAVKSVGWLIQ